MQVRNGGNGDGNGHRNGKRGGSKGPGMNGKRAACGNPCNNCRSCGRKFKAGEKSCPDCSESRACKDLTEGDTGACRRHGARNPKGEDHYNWKGGRYSKYLPDDLVPKFHALMGDKRLIELRSELALLDLFLFEQLENWREEREGDDLWKRLRWLAGKVQAAQRAGKLEQARDFLAQLLATIERGADFVELKDSIRASIDDRRKVAEAESKRIHQSKQVVAADRLLTLLGAVLEVMRESVKTHIGDPKENPDARAVMKSASNGIKALVSGRSSANH